MRSIFSLFALLLLFAGCSSQTSEPVALNPADFEKTVILISFDGFRADYIEQYRTPNLDKLIENGVWADEGMIPVYPSKTFPNHYSIVTGLYPANHGIVSNSMYDDQIDDTFSIGNRDAVSNPYWWGGEPIWVTAENQGVKAATYFWVGSEAPVSGVHASYWYPYDGSVPGSERVEQALEWLDLPEAERPGFISLYFSDVDDKGHGYGPGSEEAGVAVGLVDGHIGQLVAGLEKRGIADAVNMILVADHGMSQLSSDRVVALDDYIDLDDIKHIDGTPLVNIHPKEGKLDEMFAALDGAHPNLHVWKRGDVPERFHYEGNNRIAPIVGHVDDGWSVARERTYMLNNPDNYSGGTHGYDNQLLSMRALFIGHGSAFQKGMTIDAFENVELYNLMTDIMGLNPAQNDGTAGSLHSILK